MAILTGMRGLGAAASGLLGLVLAWPATAYEYETGDFKLLLKTELSAGLRVRMEDRASDLVGKTNLPGQQDLCNDGACGGVEGNAMYLAAPGSLSLDTDNGNLNYDQYDIVSAMTRASVKLNLGWKDDYGLFVRGIYYYDPVNADFDESHPNTQFQPAKTPRSDAAADDIGERLDLMEAYVYGLLPFFGDRDLGVKIGNQVIYWGESNFLVPYSLNSINPPDVNRIQVPGANLDEYFTPVPMVQLSTDLLDDLSLQLFYQYGWEPVEVEPGGAYFSTDDTIGAGSRFAHLGGQSPEDPDGLAAPEAPLSSASRTFYRRADRNPADGGQYGASLKWFLDDLGEGTEFGFYYANYHSRFPIGSFVAADASACRNAPAALDNVAGGLLVVPFCLAGEPAPVDTIGYFLEYPEDIRMFGLTAVTTRGVWSFQAEYAYRPNAPLQIDSYDLTFAALQPAFPREDVLTLIPGARHGVPDYVETIYRGNTVQPNQYIAGYERFKLGQLNLSALLITPDNPFGATQWLLLVETGMTHVLDFPSMDRLQLEGPGTNTHYSAGIDGTGDPNGQTDGLRFNETQQTTGFATQYSFGYRIQTELEYPDAVLGLGLKPFIAIAHDVHGTAPGNGGNFIEGRKQYDLGLVVKAPEYWSLLLQYSVFDGGDEFNLLRDRDNIALSATLNF